MKYIIIILICCSCSAKPPVSSTNKPQLIKIPPGLVIPDSGLKTLRGRLNRLPENKEYAEYVPDIPDIPSASWPELFSARKIKNSPVTIIQGDGNTLTDVGKAKEKEKTTTNDMQWLIWGLGFITLAGLIYFLVRAYVKKPP